MWLQAQHTNITTCVTADFFGQFLRFYAVHPSSGGTIHSPTAHQNVSKPGPDVVHLCKTKHFLIVKLSWCQNPVVFHTVDPAGEVFLHPIWNHISLALSNLMCKPTCLVLLSRLGVVQLYKAKCSSFLFQATGSWMLHAAYPLARTSRLVTRHLVNFLKNILHKCSQTTTTKSSSYLFPI